MSAFALPVDPAQLLLAGACLLQALALLVLVRRERRRGATVAVLEREVGLWRESCLELGRRLGTGAGPAEGFAETLARARGRAQASVPRGPAPDDGTPGAGEAREPGRVIHLPNWIPDDASDEQVALAAGIMRSEAHLANRLRRGGARARA